MDSITKIALSITTIALVAVLVVNATGTAKVVGSASSAFNSGIGQAEKG